MQKVWFSGGTLTNSVDQQSKNGKVLCNDPQGRNLRISEGGDTNFGLMY